MGAGTTADIDSGVTVLSLGLPSGDGYAVMTGPGGVRVENGRLVLFTSLEEASGGRPPAWIERHDLVAVGAGLVTGGDTDALAEATTLLRQLARLAGAEVEGLVGPGTAVGRVVSGRIPQAAAGRPALAMTYALMAQSSPSNAMMIRGEAQHEWMGALQVLERHVRWVGEPSIGGTPGATPLEAVVPGVEVLWIGADGSAGYTLCAWADPANDQDTRFLGRDGQVVAWTEPAELAAYLRDGASPMPGVPLWHRLTDTEVDLEPYEEAVVDFDELGDRIGVAMTDADARELARGASLLRDLAVAVRAEETLAALEPDRPLGLFLARDLPDFSSNPVAAQRRLRDTDLDVVGEDWRDAVADVASRIAWREGPDA
jgi:hypothetical protein